MPNLRRIVISIAFALLVLSYAAVTGPFRGADEFNHFFRAYQVSQGRLFARHAENGIVGDYLPASLTDLAIATADFPALPRVTTTREQLRRASVIPLEPQRLTLTNFPNTALFSPLNYAPAALGIIVGRIVSAPPLVLFYLARLFSACCVILCFAFAIQKLPAPACPLAVFALIPMVLFQSAMITADMMTFALAFICTSEVLAARYSRDPLQQATRLRLLVLALLISQLRPPYPLVGLAVFAIPVDRFGSVRDARKFFATFLLLLVLPFLLWNSVVPALFSQMRADATTNPQQQLAIIVTAPRHFLTALGTEIGHKGVAHIQEMIGFFCWRNFPLPWPLIVIVIAAIVLCVCSCDTAALKVTAASRIYFSVLAALGSIAAALMIYLMWNAPGREEVEGFHGRYLLPFLPLLFIALANHALKSRWIVPAASVGAALANIAALFLLARATFF